MNYILFGILSIITGVAVLILAMKAKKYTWKRIWSKVRALFALRVWVAVLAVLFIIMSVAGYILSADSEASAVLTLNYAEASGAVNTNGTRYNVNEILSDEVLSAAIKKGGFENISVTDLYNALEVAPLSQGNSYDENMYLIPTQYVISYEATKNTRKLDADNVVKLICAAYKEYYIENYADNFSVFTFDDNFDGYDYLDIISCISGQTYSISDYLYQLAEKEPSFVSSTGETFYSLASKVSNVHQELVLSNIYAYIIMNGVSKDADTMIARLEYSNMLSDFDMQKAQADYDTYSDAVKMYDNDMIRVVLVPSWDENGDYYMSRTKIGVDELSLNAQNYSRQVSEYAESISKNRTVIDVLKSSGVSTGEADTKTDEMLKTATEALKKYAAEAKLIAQEYSETRMNECIKYTVSGSSLVKTAAVCAAIGLYAYIAFMLLAAAVKLDRHPEMLSFAIEDSSSGGQGR